MVHRNSIYERQLKLGSTRALACSDGRPRQSAMRDPTNQKSPCSSLFQDIPAFAPGGEGGVKWLFLYSRVRSPGNERTCRGSRNLGTPCGIRLPSPIANRKSQIKNSSMPPSLQNSTTPIRPLPSGWGQLSTARPSFHPSPENRELGNAR